MERISVKFLVASTFLLLFASAGCDDKQINSSDLTINYSKSFGFCIGYCYRSVSINESKVEFSKSGRDSVTRTCKKAISKEEWKQLISSIDYEKFAKLDTIIGCPDCADGGAEWIEIKSGSKKHKIVFENGNAPQGTEGYIDALRNELKSFESCK